MVVNAYIMTINISLIFLEWRRRRKNHSCSSEPSPQSRLELLPFPEQHPSLTGKDESREILPELQGVPAEVVLEKGCSSALPPLKDPASAAGGHKSLWNSWTNSPCC